jgi:hypothetical protein
MEKRFKNIVEILLPPAFHMVGDGFRVHNFSPSLPVIGSNGMSPFFLMDYGSIASHGPFVMNTETEIKKAYDDYYNGKFGYLED